jgi:hypothetical protein
MAEQLKAFYTEKVVPEADGAIWLCQYSSGSKGDLR